MTGNGARVAAVWTRAGAGLLARRLTQTLAAVANATAAVELTGKVFVTRQATRNVLQVARDVAALLVISHAPFLSEVCTGWTLLFTVAVVKHGVVALMPPGTSALALRRLCATGDGGIQDGQPAVAGQLIKTGLPAGFAVSTVTRLLAAMEATVQFVATNQGAFVLRGHAAQFSTFVTAAGAFLIAAPLAGENKLIFFENCCTWNLREFGTTSALNKRSQRARSTAAFMTHLFTQMDHVVGATGQRLAACFSTGGDWVSAALSL